MFLIHKSILAFLARLAALGFDFGFAASLFVVFCVFVLNLLERNSIMPESMYFSFESCDSVSDFRTSTGIIPLILQS